ncbi:TPA: DUF1788 domain-containing protein [Enterococcus faecalis]|uniref:DUF1788 domain-containing protein n=1 Tax=Enterococcus TaxID=1350 RepID=UPI00076F9975|nr:DUF1788 domain-containing protein [Enterococcus faecalis]EGO5147186.1 DUF1788 domain-containing protein [Enterococcus faecalis]EHA3055224.1 DUF1788 domain-containing protein [Enterococcus faecalis]EJM6076474.1 DUF1788 domain-containing protein [Enterococcus faecalis]EJZ8440946.1 DUF1788 domain-containing protein [Enterococcus faecalis]EME3218435.1 DUF1788 domain-containing protein [Enterococcus faecalis]
MKKKTIEERFDVLERLLKSDDFLTNRGLGNEIGYYIFDYSPKNELLVREYINHLEAKNYPANDGYTLQVFNLYEIMMELLESKRYIDIIAQWEKKHGIMFVATRINRLLKMEEFDDAEMYFTDYIRQRVKDNSVVILTGIGEIYPLVRAHSVLNKMHLVYTKRPVIMMYPGEYDRLRLTILDTNRDANYYRAFRID